MGWSVQSLRGSWVTGFFVLILIYSHTTQGKLYLDFWNQVFLGTSWTWLSLVIFSPSCLLLYIILYYFELFNVFGGLCSFYTLERTKITGTTERKHFYRLSKSLHAQEELRKKKKKKKKHFSCLFISNHFFLLTGPKHHEKWCCFTARTHLPITNTEYKSKLKKKKPTLCLERPLGTIWHLLNNRWRLKA